MKKSIVKITLVFMISVWGITSCKSIDTLNENQKYAEILWKTKLGKNIFSSPALDNNGNIYVGTDGKGLYSLASDGTMRWQFVPNQSPRIFSSPSIAEDGTIYIGAYDGHVYALNPDGTLKWNFITSDNVLATPAIDKNGNIYIASADYKLYAVDKNGDLLWFFNAQDEILASPRIDSSGVIYLASKDNNLYAINPDGSLKWKFGTKAPFYASPAISLNQKIIYAVSTEGVLYALDVDTAQIRWTYKNFRKVYANPVVSDDGTVYVVDNTGQFKAFSPDGIIIWKHQTPGGVFSTPAIGKDGTIYLTSIYTDSDGESDTSYFIILSPEGKLIWQNTFAQDLRSSPVIANDGTVYFGSQLGYLYAIIGKDRGPSETPGRMFGMNAQHTGRFDVDNEGETTQQNPAPTEESPIENEN